MLWRSFLAVLLVFSSSLYAQSFETDVTYLKTAAETVVFGDKSYVVEQEVFVVTLEEWERDVPDIINSKTEQVRTLLEGSLAEIRSQNVDHFGPWQERVFLAHMAPDKSGADLEYIRQTAKQFSGGLLAEQAQDVIVPADYLYEETGRIPSNAENGELSALQKEFQVYYKTKFGKRNLTLSIGRTLVNGTIASLGFIAGNLHKAHAVILGSSTGLMSGTFQFFTSKISSFLSTPHLSQFVEKARWVPRPVKNFSRLAESMIKWYALEEGLLTVIGASKAALAWSISGGDASFVHLFSTEFHGTFETAVKSVMSQGLYDIAIADRLVPKKNAAIAARDFVSAARYTKMMENFSFVGSMAWATAAITDMMGLPVGNAVFIGLGSAGALTKASQIAEKIPAWQKVTKKLGDLTSVCSLKMRKRTGDSTKRLDYASFGSE